MCVGIPGQIVEILDASSDTALVEIGGTRRRVNIACIRDRGQPASHCIGAWVLVHVGFAMSRIDEDEARRTLELLQELGEMDEAMRSMQAAGGG